MSQEQFPHDNPTPDEDRLIADRLDRQYLIKGELEELGVEDEDEEDQEDQALEELLSASAVVATSQPVQWYTNPLPFTTADLGQVFSADSRGPGITSDADRDSDDEDEGEDESQAEDDSELSLGPQTTLEASGVFRLRRPAPANSNLPPLSRVGLTAEELERPDLFRYRRDSDSEHDEESNLSLAVSNSGTGNNRSGSDLD